MYKYSANVEVENAIEMLDTYFFQIELKENMYFQIGECYFLIKKNHDHTFKQSDVLQVSCYLDKKDLEGAEIKVKQAIELFVFMTDIPFTTNCVIKESVDNNIPNVNYQISKKKMLQIQKVNDNYCRIRGKKELLRNVLKLYAAALKQSYLLDDNTEDAFFTFFKIIEIIVQDEFEMEKIRLDNGVSFRRKSIEKMILNSYGIRTQENRLDELCGIVGKCLYKNLFDNIYHKILWFAKEKGMKVDIDIVSNMVSLRNEIAHGEPVSMESHIDEYRYILKLVDKIIDAKFFVGVKTKLKCRRTLI